MHWFKIHHGFSTDSKIGLIAHNLGIPRAIVSAVMLDIFEYASAQKDRGSIDGYDTESSAFNLGIEHETLVTVCNALRNRGVISDCLVVNWDKYQDIDRTAAERQRRFRERQKSSPPDNVTRDVTLRNTEENRGDKKRIDKKEYISIPEWMPLNEWEAFKQMRVKAKKPMTPYAERLVIGKLEKFKQKGHDPAYLLNQSTINNWQDIYEPKGDKNAAHIKPNANYNQPSKTERLYAAARRAAEAGGFASGFDSEIQADSDVSSMLPIIEDVR
jgi:hypothetical protein